MSDAQPSKRASTSSKRQSIIASTPSSHPRPSSLQIDATATIANHAIIGGPFAVRIRSGAVLNPQSKVVAETGNVDIGENAVLWERAVVGAGNGDTDTIVGKNVVLEATVMVDCGAEVGEGSVVEVGARIGKGAKVGRFCKIATFVNVPPGAEVPDYTIVYGLNMMRTDLTARENDVVGRIREKAHERQIGGLQMLIPSNLAKWQ